MIVDKSYDPTVHAALSGIEKLINAVVENAVSEIKTLTEHGGSNEQCLHIAYMTAAKIDDIMQCASLIRSKGKR